MTISRLQTGIFRYFNPNTGKPLKAGKVYVYDPGTTSLKNSYTSQAGGAGNLNTNPVILDSEGQAFIFLDGECDIAIYDSNDVLVKTIPNIYGSLDESDIQDLVDDAVIGSGLTYSVQPITEDATLTSTSSANLVLVDATAGNVTVTLPTASTMDGLPEITIKRVDDTANTLIIDGAGSETIDGGANVGLDVESATISLRSDGTEWFTSMNPVPILYDEITEFIEEYSVDYTDWKKSYGTPKQTATTRAEAVIMADDHSDMVGFAAEASVDGGDGGSTYWVVNDSDSAQDHREGSLRWAVEQVRTDGSGIVIFDPRNSFNVTLVSQLELPPNITIDAPGRNVAIQATGDTTQIKIVDDNVIMSRLKLTTIPKITSTDRDAGWLDPTASDGVWIRECTFEKGFDGLLDIAAAGILAADRRTTISRCLFRGHDKTMLTGALGAADTDTTHILLTISECFFDHVGQRNPKAAQQVFAHVINCYFRIMEVAGDDGSLGDAYGIWASTGGQALVESCWFEAMTDDHADPYDGAYATTGSAVKIVDCQAKNDITLVETDPGTVMVPPYSITKYTTADTEENRVEFFNTLIQLVGSEPDSVPMGDFVFDATSTARPDGIAVVGINADTAGRFIRQKRLPIVETVVRDDPNTTAIPRHPTTLSISSGAITVTPTGKMIYHTVATEGGAATDSLRTINFSETPADGQMVMIMPSSSGYTITLEHSLGNFLMGDGANKTLNGANGATAVFMWAAHRSSLIFLY